MSEQHVLKRLTAGIKVLQEKGNGEAIRAKIKSNRSNGSASELVMLDLSPEDHKKLKQLQSRARIYGSNLKNSADK